VRLGDDVLGQPPAHAGAGAGRFDHEARVGDVGGAAAVVRLRVCARDDLFAALGDEHPFRRLHPQLPRGVRVKSADPR
jgi:hypothetical protein